MYRVIKMTLDGKSQNKDMPVKMIVIYVWHSVEFNY